ncbi:MAG: hypothetical protein Q9170_000858 [Blastenia crenularia]
MAQIQLKTTLKRKTKQIAPKAPATETAQQPNISQRLNFEQQQSYQFVHTLLHSSLAYLAYLRHLFPEDCFEDRTFEAICKDAAIKARTGDGAEDPRKKQRKSTKTDDPLSSQLDLKVLIQNSHPGVNTFLGWLDGILEGILKCNITAAQFSVCPDQTDRANVIESYIFRFYYCDTNGHNGRRLRGLALAGTRFNSILIKNATEGLYDLIGLIIDHTKKMPDLPVLWLRNKYRQYNEDALQQSLASQDDRSRLCGFWSSSVSTLWTKNLKEKLIRTE